MLSNSSQRSPSDPGEISVLNNSDKKKASHQGETLDLDHIQNKTHVPKFSIRDYVCKSRSKNLKKNWPFSDKNLQLCLKNGVQNPLPPFQTPEEMRKELPSNQDDTFPCSGEAKNSSNSSASREEEELANPSLGQPLIPKSSVMNLHDHTMVSKVCPVCKTFSSSSNTTLNAHIDQCLSVVSTKSTSSVIHRKIKSRKIRLMVDIYATAKHCTLEELELRNGRPWPPQDQAIDFYEENPEDCNEGDQEEGSVYIDSNGTKLRILSGPELGNGGSFHNAWKGAKKGNENKRKHLKKLPKIKANRTLNSRRDLEAGKVTTVDGSSREPTLQTMLASMGKWPCAKRAFASSRKSTKRKHVVNEDSIEECDVVLSTIRKLSSWGKRRRKLVVAESQSDSSRRNSMAGRISQEHSQPELDSSNSKRGETENSYLQTGTVTSLSNSIETKFSKLQLSPSSNSLSDSFRPEEAGLNGVGDDAIGRNLSELKQLHDNKINGDGNEQSQELLASDYLSQISDSRLDILNPMPECFASGSNLQSSLEGPFASPSSTSVIRLMGKNLMVNNNTGHVIPFKQWSAGSHSTSGFSLNSHYRAIDQMIHCQPPSFDVHLGNGMRFQETLEAPVYQMRSDNIILPAPQNTVGSEAFLYGGGGGTRLEQARPAPNIRVPMTAPRMEWDNSFYHNRYHQLPQAADQETIANAHQVPRWNHFGGSS